MSNPQGSPFAHLLRGVGNVFRGTGEYPPDILQDVATGLAAAQWRQSGGEQPIYSNPNLWQGSNYRPTPIPQVPVIQPTPIHQYTPSTVVRGALRRVESQRPQVHQPSGSTGGNPLAGMVNQAASNPIHQSQQSAAQTSYTDWPGFQSDSSDAVLRALDPNFGRGPSLPIQENPAWVQGNLAHAAWPMTMLDRLALQQAHQQVLQRQQAMNAQNASARAQRELIEAQTHALREQEQSQQHFGFQGWKAAPMKTPPSLTETPEFLGKLEELRGMAKQLKEMKNLDDVDAVAGLMERAAKLSNNNTQEFIFLMNEVLVGNTETMLGLEGLFAPLRHYKRFNFGDEGMHPLYQDGSPVQMTHFWAYVNYGYSLPKDIAKAGNLVHELADPRLPNGISPLQTRRYFKGSEEDLRLGVVGVNIGQALSKGHLTPLKLSRKLDDILRTDRYNELSPNNIWLGPIPKQKNKRN